MKKLGIIGYGKLGEAIANGLIKQAIVSPNDMMASVRRESSLLKRQSENVNSLASIEFGRNNQSIAQSCKTILLAVKPQNVEAVLNDIDSVLTEEHLLISVAASVTTSYIETRLSKPVPVIRAMPNTPSVINAGMTALSKGKFATEEQLAFSKTLFDAIGKTVIVEEYLMDGVTALSASGPAYIYVVIEALAEAGVKLGIPRDVSTLLAAQTMYGASKLVLETNIHPAVLKDSVTTPAGCTIDGLLELEEGGLRVTLIKAVVKAAERASELVKK
ncbi:MAG: pyrroline-5-carboxylate reductase [Chloroherpetonaceae bacterium]|nr:pyrroline-5-carboxylate reductase [Chloroherpetonaceae bacterium]